MRVDLNWLIERIFFSGLVFNQSWEDPAIDEAALQIVPDRDTVLSVTSGGCNSLNLLCQSPKRLICIDSNPVQTYLLDLKLAGIRQLDFDDFFDFFAARHPERSPSVYYASLRQALPPEAKRFWDGHIRLFRRGIFGQGKLGLFLRILRAYLRFRLHEKTIEDFFETETLQEQTAYYFTHISPKVWRDPLLRIVNSRLLLHLAGMHPQQYALVAQNGGLERYVRRRVEFVLTRIPIRGNYFLAQAALGRYRDQQQVPPYLQEANFVRLKRNVERVSNVTASLKPYLDRQPVDSIDKFCLLDIFDWMDESSFKQSLASVLRAGSQNGRFIYRSLIPALPVPAELAPAVVPEPGLANELLERDRSCVYTSLYIYRIRKQGALRASF